MDVRSVTELDTARIVADATREVSALSQEVDDEEQERRRLRRLRLLTRLAVVAIVALTLTGIHLWNPGKLSWVNVAFTVGGLVAGLMLSNVRLWPSNRQKVVAEVVSDDLGRLEQCFTILQKQVTVTIKTSETAVLEMANRLNRVYHLSAELHSQIKNAVDHSQVLSQSSLAEAGKNGEAVRSLADHQRKFMDSHRQNQERIRAVVDQVRHLTPLAALIADISKQTNLLSINASIEAARAGPEGAGFKVVATEVRRLSAQTAEAARQITEGINAVASAIDMELMAADALDSNEAGEQLRELAEHITEISQSLGEVVPYLVDLSTHMHQGMTEMTDDIINALGNMQFQDINRQVLEQVESALGSLSDHSAALYALVGGKAPPPPQKLEELMARWSSNYVMHEQRVAHAEASRKSVKGGQAGGAGAAQAAPEPVAAEIEGAKIELF